MHILCKEFSNWNSNITACLLKLGKQRCNHNIQNYLAHIFTNAYMWLYNTLTTTKSTLKNFGLNITHNLTPDKWNMPVNNNVRVYCKASILLLSLSTIHQWLWLADITHSMKWLLPHKANCEFQWHVCYRSLCVQIAQNVTSIVRWFFATLSLAMGLNDLIPVI